MDTKDMMPTIPDDAFLFRRGRTTLDGFGRVMGSWEENSDVLTIGDVERIELIGELRLTSVYRARSGTIEDRAFTRRKIRESIYKHFYGGLYCAMTELAILIAEGNKKDAEALAWKIKNELQKAGE